MMIYENDKLVIPKKYQEMSVSELNAEKEKVLKELCSQPRPPKKYLQIKRE